MVGEIKPGGEFDMRAHRRISGLVLGFWGAALVVLALGTGTSIGQAKKDKKTDAKKNYNHYLKQLQARFTAWDTSNDGTLDTTELAKAFRGPDAKPYDKINSPATATPNPDAIGDFQRSKPTRNSVAVASLLQRGCPVNFAVGEMMTWKKAPVKNPAPFVDVTQFPDYQFLLLTDGNKDNKITKVEFDNWAKGFATKLDHYDHTLKTLQTAQNNFAKAKPAAKQKAALEVQTRQAELTQAQAQINTVPPAIQATLKIQK
jgi:hypothetical protein